MTKKLLHLLEYPGDIPTSILSLKILTDLSARINLRLFSTVLPSNSRLFLSCRHFVVITRFSTGLVGVENVVITKKSLQDRNNLLLDGRTVENNGKLTLTEILP